MYAQTCERDVAEAAREALYDELRTRALARRDWTRLLGFLRLTLRLLTLFAAALLVDYDLDVLGRLGVSINLPLTLW